MGVERSGLQNRYSVCGTMVHVMVFSTYKVEPDTVMRHCARYGGQNGREVRRRKPKRRQESRY